MNKYFIVGSLLFGLLRFSGGVGISVAQELRTGDKRVKISRLPELVVFEKDGRKEGVSAAFGGTLGDAIVVAGGCNFPNVPAADGGKKVYYDQIYVLRHPEQKRAKWELAGKLPVSAANGASVTLPEGIVCIGGCHQKGALSGVWLLQWNADGSAIVSRSLSELPVAMDNFAAATDGKRIFVAGGNIDGKPGKRSFVLDSLDAPMWQELPVVPGPMRLQPSAVVVKGKFYLLGGFLPRLGGQECMIATDGLVYDPVYGGWKETGAILPEGEIVPRALVGASGVVLRDSIVVFQGGVHREVFKAAVDNPLLQRRAAGLGQREELERLRSEQAAYMRHEPGWYKFNRQLLLFRPEEGRWTALGDWEEVARAGALLLVYKDKLVVVNGETKPGIRSAGVYMIDMN
ncbi:MAG: cyclically-permuted mutarotase family protein [Odoribacter sp.]|nr:cyclically-permuted mutarotase family protein [Odoribacter sp.]